MIRILVADDHAIVRKGLIEILRETFLTAQFYEVTNGMDALIKVREGGWDLVLLDISMPLKNGIETLKQMGAEGIKVPILVLSMQPDEQYAIRVLKAGGSGFINKNNTTNELIIAVQKVLSGRKYISTYIAEIIAENMNSSTNAASHEQLSDREMQVMQLIASGKTISEIASIIYLSVNTVSTYRARLLTKLSLNNNAELTRYVLENGLV
jgi:two-component system invasion response regulator UvrY